MKERSAARGLPHEFIARSLALIWILLASLSFPVDGAAALPSGIVLLIGDGMGTAQLTAAMVEGGGLNIERMEAGGLVKTFPSGDLITDSAASATAFATGHKTVNGMLSITPSGDTLLTVVECAERNGMRTGIVATCSVTHATPAAFASHVESRDMESEIAAQIARSGLDVIIGGGRGWFIPRGERGSKRKDGLDLLQVMDSGPGIVNSLKDLECGAARTGAVLFLADGHCPPLSGRDYSLAELTAAALRILSSSPKGFFLMVEGSQIDWEAHDGDGEGVVAETLDFDGAVGAAMDFAEESGRVLVIVTADHETGGMSVRGRKAEGFGKEDLSFSTDGHTASMVPILAFGPGSERFSGILDNSEVGKRLMQIVGCGDVEVDESSFEGDWSGKLSFSGMELFIVFHIHRSADGAWNATMDSPDQGARGIPASVSAVRGDSIFVDVASAAGRYEGRMELDSLRIEGVWKQAGYEIPLVVHPANGEFERKRPQEPLRPLPYREIDARFHGGGKGVTLEGTLTIPDGEGPFPGVVLLTGSGPQDRDETVMGYIGGKSC